MAAMIPAQRTGLARISPGLQLFCLTLVLPVLLVLVLSSAFGAVGAMLTTSSTQTSEDQIRDEVANKLLAIRTMPADAVEIFRKSGELNESALLSLAGADRQKADAALSYYRTSRADLAAGDTGASGSLAFAIVATYVICVPIFIVGLIRHFAEP